MSSDTIRLALAALLTALYLLLVVGTVLRQRRRAAPVRHQATGTDSYLVAYASQTGTAQFLAEQTAATLRSGGVAAVCVSVAALDTAMLARSSRLLIIASTYGEGDPPDSAARLTRLLADPALSLGALHLGMLALGDATYQQFCGYGRALERQLIERGAQLLFPRIEADRRDAAAIAEWQQQLSHLLGTSDAPDWSAPPFEDWHIVERVLVNPGSAGAPVYRIALLPADGAMPAWQAGDLAQVSAPDDSEHPREYSIASTAAEGSLQLLVRLHLRADGAMGAASGWLCRLCDPLSLEHKVRLRVRAHPNFRLGENATRPLILIGNGTGLAGLRSLLKERIDAGQQRNWLLFGERSAAHDHFYQNELDAWQRDGAVSRVDLAYSRDQPPAYVQDLLMAQRARLLDWVGDGAAIYVCGSLQGMAGAVHQALVDVLGEAAVIDLQDSGRYRRDVY